MSHNGFPGFTVCADGSFFCCYRKGTHHNEPPTSTAGILKAKRSTDQGLTWGSEYTIWTAPAGFEVRDSMAATLSDGRVAVTFNRNDYPGYNPTSFVMFSSDLGVTFGTPVQIISTGLLAYPPGEGLAMEGPIVELPSGDLLVAVYSVRPGGTRLSSIVLKSTDDGATWADLALIANGDAESQDYMEPILLLLDTGELLCGLRRESDGKIYLSRSSDNGATWSAPRFMFSGSGRPVMTQASNGAVVCAYRSTATNDSAMRTSWNRCWSWEPEFRFDADLFRITYAQMQPVATGVIGCLYGMEETSAADSSIRYTTFRAREAVDPLA